MTCGGVSKLWKKRGAYHNPKGPDGILKILLEWGRNLEDKDDKPDRGITFNYKAQIKPEQKKIYPLFNVTKKYKWIPRF